MDFLKKFQNVENYTNFVNSDYFKLPNVSLTDEDYDVHYTNFISQGGEEEEETEPAVTLTYKVNSPDERVAFWNGGENIKRLYVDGEEIPFDPAEITSETTDIPGSTFVFDGNTVTCPDSCFLTSVPSRITLAPKDSSVQINKDIVFSFIKRDLLDDNYYTDIEFSDFIAYAGIGNIIDNKLVIDNQNFLSYINDLINDNYAVTFALTNGYSSAPASLEADIDTASAEPEIQVLDIIMTTEVITGGLQTPFLFDYPGQHIVKMVLNDTDFGGNGMFSYYEDEVQESSLLTNSSVNYCALQSVVINDKVTSILPGTFYQSSLYKVKIGSSVTSIGEGAFFKNNIETVIIPDSVTRIDDYAFQYCYDLRFVKFSKNLTTIGDGAFENTWIGDVDLPASITYIGRNAFNYCGAINSARINSNGNTVIGDSAFYGCNNLRQLTLAEGITRIGDYAFNNTNITNIELPDSVVELGYTPFHSYIETIKLGAGITSISYAMFRYYYNLKSVEIGEGCTSIGEAAFYNCSGLTSVIIPDSVTSIGEAAFQNCSKLTSVVIPDSVTSIGEDTFRNCSGLTSVVIPDSVTSIGNYAFYNCSGLTSVVIPDSVTSIGNYAFYGCTSLKKITCHAVTAPSIQSYTFQNVSTFGKLIYPEGSDYSSWLSTNSYYLGYYYWNQKLGTIVATYNVTDTTNQTKLCNTKSNFYSVYKIDGVCVTGNTSFTAYTFDTVGEHTVTFKEMKIVSSMFNSTPCLKSVKISKDITSISTYAFSDCPGLESIVVSSRNTAYDSRENCNCIIETSTNTLISGCKNSFIPDSVTSIGQSAFRGCSGLTSVMIPDSVTSIGQYAFCNCKGLTEITCHAVTAPSIQSYTFQNVSTLGKLIYPEGSDYSSWLSTNSYYLGYYYWNEKLATIKCTYNVATTDSATKLLNSTSRVYEMTVDGVSMTPSTTYQFNTIGEHNVEITVIGYIDDSVFRECSSLTSVVIPDSVTSIGQYAFRECSSLTSVVIPDSVTSIGQYAFYGCSSLPVYDDIYYADTYLVGAVNTGITSCIIKEGTKWIGDNAFYECSGLTGELIIPDSVTSIGRQAFYECSGLTGELIIPDSVTSIGSSAFSECSGLTGELVIPDLVTSIGMYTFYNCKGLTSVVIGNGCTSIGQYAFESCSGLTSLEIGSGVTSIGGAAFRNCTGLTGELSIPDSVTSIDGYVFYNCSKLTSVVIGNGCTSIGQYAFQRCSYLTSLEIGSGVTSIGNYAFSGCTSLEKITCHAVTAPSIQSYTFYNIKKYGYLRYPEGSDYSSWLSTNSYRLGYYEWTDSIAVVNCTYNITTTDSETKLLYDASEVLSMTVDGINITPSTLFQFDSIGEHNVEIGIVKKIPNNLFKECMELTSVVIPDSVASIGESAFGYCSGLTGELVIPDSVKSIGYSAFYQCKGLTSVEIGSGCTSIGGYAFGYCSGLTGELVIPDSVASIGSSAFEGCKGLTNVEIGNGCTSIGEYAFENCSGLTSVVIPDSVKSIYRQAFWDCNKLTSVVIGSGCTSIDSSAFHGCSGLTSIIISSGNTVYDSRENCNCIIKTSTNTLIQGCKTSFIPDSITSIGSSAFSGCKGLTSIVIPDSVTSIDYDAFYYCTGLKSVVIGSGVTSIGRWAFLGCSGLTGELVIPDSVASIGSSAFEGCKGLTSLEIGSGCTSISDGAFEDCSRLKKITCHAVTAPSISSETFRDVSLLGKLIYPEGSDYSSWMSENSYYLGNNFWFAHEIGTELPELTLDGYDVAMLVQPLTNSSATQICNVTTNISEIKINDTVLDSISTGHTFSTPCEWNVVRVKYTAGTTSIPLSGFKGCKRIYEMKMADSVTSIDYAAFQYCYGLTNMEIGSGVTSIGSSVFYGCSGLTGELVIPDSVTSIGQSAFAYCDGLAGELVIPDSVTSIGSSAFESCTGLTSVEIGSGCTNIGNSAFQNCSSLESIVVSSGNTVYDSRENCNCIIKTSTNTLIQGCKTSFIPDSVTSIGQYAFYNCKGLTGELVIPDLVTSIGDYAFYECSGLTGELVIPNSVTSIGQYAFSNCSGLTGELVIPDSVKSISYSAFHNCSGLESLKIGSRCTSIVNESFWGCSGLKSIIVSSENTKYDSRENCNCLIETSINKIRQGSNNSFIPNSVTSIGQLAFSDCKGLTSIVIPDSVTSIDGHAFSGSGLKSVVIPDSVTSIGNSVFWYCSELESVEIGSEVTSIAQDAFSACTSLKKIICHAVTAPSIGSTTFYNVKQYGTLYVPFGSDYSSWMKTSNYYLGYYKWTQQAIYSPTECTSLSITADDVSGRATKTTIYWTAVTNGVDLDGNPMNNMTITGETISSEFPQNTSETETVERTITFEYKGVTASTTITQGVWVSAGYTVDLNSQWQLSTSIANPDSAVYEGVYESFSNKGVDSSAAIMYIDIVGYETFQLYIRSNAESSYDFVVVSNLDCTLTNETTSGSNVKMTTSGKQNSGTTISNYTLVEFTGIDSDEHRISVMYRKDGSSSTGTDQGYVLIPKNQ